MAIVEALSETTNVVEKIVVAIVNLNSGIISPELLPITDVKVMLPSLQNKIANQGYTLETTQPLQVYQLPFSFVIQNGVLELFIHLLAFNPFQRFSLWQYIQLPFFVNNDLVQVNDKHKFIAINEETDHVMLLEDINQCDDVQSKSNEYVCPKIPILKEFQNLCLPSLYFHGNLASCEVEKSASLTSWFITLIESVAVFFPEITTLIRSCPNAGTTVETVDAGIHFLNHTSSCSVHSDQILLPSRPHLANHSVSLFSVNVTAFNPPTISPPRKDTNETETLAPLEPFEPEDKILEVFQTLFSVSAFILVIAIICLLIYFVFSKAPTETSSVLGV